MFEIIMWVTIGCAVFGLWFWMLILAIDGYWVAGVVAFVLFVLGISWLFYAIAQEEDTGPCLRSETGYMYSPATKTMMPYTHCVDRGTWVKE